MHRPGARHGNADALSRRPEVRAVTANPSGSQQIEVDVTSHMMTDWQTVSSAPDAVSYKENGSPSAGENPQGDDITRAQETDPEMGRLVRMVREGVKPSLETFAAESETAKIVEPVGTASVSKWTRLSRMDAEKRTASEATLSPRIL